MPAGPRKKPKVDRWPCAVCTDNCDASSVQCDSYSKWVHAHCEGLKNSDLSVVSKLSYICRICVSQDDGGAYRFNSALFRLREAAEISLDHLRVVAKREKTLMPVNVTHAVKFDSSQLRLDYSALIYLDSCEGDIQLDHQPILTKGNGNCLFNALSIAISGTEDLSDEIRVSTCVEMATNQEYYLSQPFANNFLLCSPPFEESCINCATPGGYSSAWTIQAAADALCRDIHSVYPKMNGKNDHTALMLTRVHSSRHKRYDILSIMWTKMGPHTHRII